MKTKNGTTLNDLSKALELVKAIYKALPSSSQRAFDGRYARHVGPDAQYDYRRVSAAIEEAKQDVANGVYAYMDQSDDADGYGEIPTATRMHKFPPSNKIV